MLAVAGSAGAAEWTPIGSTPEYKVYVDQTSIKKKGRYLQVRSRSELLVPVMINNQKVIAAHDLVSYDCANRDGQLKHEDLIGVNGEPVNAKANLPHNAPITFWLDKPGTPAGLIFTYACTHRAAAGE